MEYEAVVPALRYQSWAKLLVGSKALNKRIPLQAGHRGVTIRSVSTNGWLSVWFYMHTCNTNKQTITGTTMVFRPAFTRRFKGLTLVGLHSALHPCPARTLALLLYLPERLFSWRGLHLCLLFTQERTLSILAQRRTRSHRFKIRDETAVRMLQLERDNIVKSVVLSYSHRGNE
ncbi:WD-40 repeat-containing protein [Anopheles sinensis]|uniref:WD-40 repeat-containing protein n=1 Tax=Anopheles sinensis TaxID=74873 RepID=A0A084VXQ8_ANOSI|nr:WD-40 repeat-containing protein [Anopheles sinensis]